MPKSKGMQQPLVRRYLNDIGSLAIRFSALTSFNRRNTRSLVLTPPETMRVLSAMMRMPMKMEPFHTQRVQNLVMYPSSEPALATCCQAPKPGSTTAKPGAAASKLGTASAPAPVIEPVKPRESTPLPVTTTKPKAPLKSFGSLDALFRK